MQQDHLQVNPLMKIKPYDGHACRPLTFMKAFFSRAFIITGGMAVKKKEEKKSGEISNHQYASNRMSVLSLAS